jgi:hypothetical protein
MFRGARTEAEPESAGKEVPCVRSGVQAKAAFESFLEVVDAKTAVKRRRRLGRRTTTSLATVPSLIQGTVS